MAQVNLFHFLALVLFLARSKPKIPFLGLSLLRNLTETLATQARVYMNENDKADTSSQFNFYIIIILDFSTEPFLKQKITISSQVFCSLCRSILNYSIVSDIQEIMHETFLKGMAVSYSPPDDLTLPFPF